ncbi:MAG TPA: superoxide dismutase [Tepidisphaeraceae bacterium]|nr:superoxide dismutase [Tepidisphaeraceae bacterium]
MPATHKPLPYPHAALEPTIDAKTMEIHHGLHYKAYVDNYNKALEKAPQLVEKRVEDVIANNLAAVPDEIKGAVRNNGGGVVNHELFWELLTPGGPKTPVGNLAKAIDSTFGSFDKFKELMVTAGTTRFGSGWAWLAKSGGKLEVYSLPNQDSPLMEGKTPIVGIDVWEHAYYLKYQNKRPAYLGAIWDVINWKVAEEKFNK